MGSFKGHILPGSFFLIMGFWWSTKSILKYVCKKQMRACHLDSKTLFHRMEILEGITLICMALTGIVGEQFISGGPYLILYKEGQWNQLTGWHHCTMYFFFGLVGVANILCFTISPLPVSLIKLILSNAFFVETFIFHNHTHGREMLDIFVHQMLVLVSFVTGLLAFMEFLMRNNVLLELLRTSLILLQGSWFWQIGFVLYPPSGGPAWDLNDHDNIMFLAICFCWHYALSYIIIGVDYAFVTWLTTGPHLHKVWAASKNSARIQGNFLPHVRSPPESEEDYDLFLFQKPSED